MRARPSSATKSAAPQSNRRMLALAELGRLHAPAARRRGDGRGGLAQPRVADEPGADRPLYAGFVDAIRRRRSRREHREVCERLVGSFDAYLDAERRQTALHGLVHGDYRLDNMLFGQPGADRPLTVVDWQTVTWGPAMTDVAYFLGCALADELRRDNYDALLRRLPRSARPRRADQPRRRPRRRAAAELLRGDDGDRLVDARRAHRTRRRDVHDDAAAAQRACARHRCAGHAARTLGNPAAEPLTPAAADEGAHPAGDEPLWSESWYFDFADAQQGVGGWIRLGL